MGNDNSKALIDMRRYNFPFFGKRRADAEELAKKLAEAEAQDHDAHFERDRTYVGNDQKFVPEWLEKLVDSKYFVGANDAPLVVDGNGNYVSGSWYDHAERDHKLKFMANSRKMAEEFLLNEEERIWNALSKGYVVGDGILCQIIGAQQKISPQEMAAHTDDVYRNYFKALKAGWKENHAWEAPAPVSGWRSSGDDVVDAMAFAMQASDVHIDRSYRLPWWIRALNWCRNIFNTK